MKPSKTIGLLGWMVSRASAFIPLAAKNRLHRGLYEYLARRAEEHEDLHFWNFGYAGPDSTGRGLPLDDSEERHRYCLQLYDHVASGVDLRGKDVLEVGCGCGGGSNFLMRRHSPNSIRGIDQAENAIGFCNRHHSVPGLSFSCAQAESLPFENDSFDVVINLESSHCYGFLSDFFAEVHRVLRPEGHFLFADFRRRDQMEPIHAHLKRSGFRFLKEEIITPYVLRAMELDHRRKMNLLTSKAPKPLLNSLKYWWGTKDSRRYELFRSGEEIYFSYVLKKRDGAGLPSKG